MLDAPRRVTHNHLTLLLDLVSMVPMGLFGSTNVPFLNHWSGFRGQCRSFRIPPRPFLNLSRATPMNRFVVAFTLGVGLLAASPLRADDSPHLEFVRALRARNYTDEALEYLSRLDASKDVSKEVKSFIPLEKANCFLDRAAREADSTKRDRDYDKAQLEFDKLINAAGKDGSPYSAIAQLEKARIQVLKGRAAMARVRGMKDLAAQKIEMGKVLVAFQDAETEITKAIDALVVQLDKKPAVKAIEAALIRARLEAEMEQHVNQVDQATTYEVLGKSLDIRGTMIDKAIKALDGIYEKDNKGPTGWMARVWRGKALAEIDKGDDAQDVFKRVSDSDGTYAEAARRQARFFHFMLPLLVANRVKMTKNEQRDLGEAWLRDYSGHANTLDGIQIRYELGTIYMLDGYRLLPDRENPKPEDVKKARPDLEKAMDLFGEVASTDNEFKSPAALNEADIRMLLNEGLSITTDDILRAETFDQLFRAATGLGYQISREERDLWRLKKKENPTEDDKKKIAAMEKQLPELRKEHLRNIELALSRALESADRAEDARKPKPVKIAEVRALLAWVCLENGNPYRAAIVGEHAARAGQGLTGSDEPAKAAGIALQAYATIISQSGNVPEEFKPIVDNDRQRMRQLVEFMVKTWEKSPETNKARHYYGVDMIRQKNFKEAASMLKEVTDSYYKAGLVEARYWWYYACQQLINEDIPEADKEKYKKDILTALKGVPDDPGEDVPMHIAQVWVVAKLQLGSQLYEAKEYAALEKLSKNLVERIPKLRLEDAMRDDGLRQAENLVSYAVLARANADVAAGKYRAALDMVDDKGKVLDRVEAQMKESLKPQKPLVDEIKALEKELKDKFDKPKLTKDEEAQKEELQEKIDAAKEKLDVYVRGSARHVGLYRELVLVALRACVLDGNSALASRRYFPKLQEAVKDDSKANEVYYRLGFLIKKQLDDLKQQPGKEKEVAQLVDNFNKFLVSVRAGLEDKKQLTPAMIFFLAASYSGLGNHQEAGKTYEMIKPPSKDPATGKVNESEQKQYERARMNRAREFRLEGKANAKPDKTGRPDAPQFEECRKLILWIKEQEWGQGLEPKQEMAWLRHDQGYYGGATAEWKKVIDGFGAKPKFEDPKVKAAYFDAYYNFVYCKYMYSKVKWSGIDDAKRTEHLVGSANLIVKLEDSQKDMGGEAIQKRYQELLAQEPPLKKEYDRLKAEKKPDPKDTPKDPKK